MQQWCMAIRVLTSARIVFLNSKSIPGLDIAKFPRLATLHPIWKARKGAIKALRAGHRAWEEGPTPHHLRSSRHTTAAAMTIEDTIPYLRLDEEPSRHDIGPYLPASADDMANFTELVELDLKLPIGVFREAAQGPVICAERPQWRSTRSWFSRVPEGKECACWVNVGHDGLRRTTHDAQGDISQSPAAVTSGPAWAACGDEIGDSLDHLVVDVEPLEPLKARIPPASVKIQDQSFQRLPPNEQLSQLEAHQFDVTQVEGIVRFDPQFEELHGCVKLDSSDLWELLVERRTSEKSVLGYETGLDTHIMLDGPEWAETLPSLQRFKWLNVDNEMIPTITDFITARCPGRSGRHGCSTLGYITLWHHASTRRPADSILSGFLRMKDDWKDLRVKVSFSGPMGQRYTTPKVSPAMIHGQHQPNNAHSFPPGTRLDPLHVKHSVISHARVPLL
ncbi:hypothetical protein C8R46DRAFT_1028547 [Mycena filopes]|nr:hypothetical protein C8R46DRAFT_1028547 [Mycena filopes]